MKTNPKNSHSSGNISRRSILTSAISVGTLAALGVNTSAYGKEDGSKAENTHLKKGAIIVFQGDSITDAGRKKDITLANDTRALGQGYAASAAGLLHASYPEHELKIYNRGISGNKVPDLDARWKEDAVDLKPDILSIMVGVNDYWHTIAFGSKYKGTVQDYETGYRKLIERSQKEIPDVRLVICDPFTFRDWEAYKPYQAAAKKLANEFDLTFVAFQEVFEPLRETVSEKFWLWDGIHPTAPGHALMAKVWRKSVNI